MPSIKFTTIDDALIMDIIDAKNQVKQELKGKYITYNVVLGLIKKLRGDLNRVRKNYPTDNRYIRLCELIVLFAEDFHDENIRKYESYQRKEGG